MEEMEEFSLYGTLVRGIKKEHPNMAWVENLFENLRGNSADYLSLPAVKELNRSWTTDTFQTLEGVGPEKAEKIKEAIDLWSRSKEARG